MVLIAPFASVQLLLDTYKLFETVPLLGPFRNVKPLMNALLSRLTVRFDSLSKIQVRQTLAAPSDHPC